MSMGPSKVEEQLKTKPMAAARQQIAKVVKQYSADPLSKLFYFMLFLTISGLFFGAQFPWQYYVILIALATIQIFKYFYGTKSTSTN